MAEHDYTAFQRFVDDVLKFIVELNFSIHRPTFEIFVATPYINCVKNIHAEPLK